MVFHHALVRAPADLYKNCITSHPLRDSIDIKKVRKQHLEYCFALEELGLELIRLPRLETLPDSCFIEDTAIIYNKKAFITRMGAIERRGEVDSVGSVLKEYLEVVNAKKPATIEGGDVIHLENRLISGVTQRTNQEGIRQLGKKLNIKVNPCIDPSIVHLKSYVTYLGNNTVITTRKYSEHPVFEKFDKIIVDKEEEYAANTLAINNTVLIANGYDKTSKKIREANFDVIKLETTEFQKCEGALTCLSLLF